MPDALPAPDPQRRVTSLDGLRGWAALIVVIYHGATSALPWYDPSGAQRWPAGSPRWWLVQTPLHIVWAGPEMVVVFFVLSGYVLTLPALARSVNWLRYYPRRFVRLYLPAWAATAFATALHYLPSRHPIPHNAALNSFAIPITLGNGLKTAALVGPLQALPAFTTALWSMRWEVIFSIMLPAVVITVLTTRRRAALTVIAGALCAYALVRPTHGGHFVTLALHYLPVFVLGSLLAVRFPPTRTARSPRSEHPAATIALLLLTIGLLTAGYWIKDMDAGSVTGWPYLAAAAGACLAVWLAITNGATARALTTSTSQWLGHRSYSLYLIHYPIVLSLAFAFNGTASVPLLLITSVPASLVAADLLYRCVERPAIQLSRRIASHGNRRTSAERP